MDSGSCSQIYVIVQMACKPVPLHGDRFPFQPFISTSASRAILIYIPYSAWRKYAARGSESTSTLRESNDMEKLLNICPKSKMERRNGAFRKMPHLIWGFRLVFTLILASRAARTKHELFSYLPWQIFTYKCQKSSRCGLRPGPHYCVFVWKRIHFDAFRTSVFI